MIIQYNRKDKEQVIAQLKTNNRLQLIEDVIAEMECCACFHPKPTPPPSKTILSADFYHHKSITYHAKETKVGRNAPCPCGSGKKYKKRCLH